MMKKLITLIAAVSLCASLGAQIHQGLGLSRAEIEAFVSDSAAYYSLLERIVSQDPDVTDREYALAYYGYTYTNRYFPDLAPFMEESFLETGYGENNPSKALEDAMEYLDFYPLNCLNLMLCVNFADMTGEDRLSAAFDDRLQRVCDIITDSGDGSEENPYLAVNASDEWFFFSHRLKIYEEMVSEVGEGSREGLTFIRWTDPEGAVRETYFSIELCGTGAWKDYEWEELQVTGPLR